YAIFREVASNLLIHREYTNAYPAKLIIEYGQVRTENSSRPHGFGQLDPKNFTPFPKNPVIARFFRQIGLADELGSGMRKMMKYSQAYGGSNPELVEGDVFRIRIQVPEFSRQMLSEAPVEAPVEATPEVTPEVAREVNPEVMRLLKLVVGEMSRHELQIRMGLKDSEHFRKSYLMPALASGLMEMTNPDKPRSSRQRYRVTAKGKSQVLLSKTGEENE
ncbi:MAG: AAA family ATPase, partial [Candidatus Cloacimonetes bacterium]|nr:AAA family ATPase [Candidatus Cloacimonadota bacterium]